MWTLVSGLGLAGAGVPAAQRDLYASGSAEGAPIAALFLIPWTTEHIEETYLPRLVVYSDGRILYLQRAGDSGPMKLFQARLAEGDFSALRRRLVPTAEFMELKPAYNLQPCMLDGPVAKLYLASEDIEKGVSVRGFFWEGSQLDPTISGQCNERADELPVQFTHYVEILRRLEVPSGSVWHPSFYSIDIAPWDYVGVIPGDPIDWPSAWPGLDNARETRPGREEYQLLLPLELEEEALVLSITEEAEKMRPVRIDGRLWKITSSPVVPGSCRWERFFDPS